MKALELVQNKLDVLFERLTENLERMSPRERVMVVFTTLFVLVAGVGSALFYTHKAAENQQKRLNEIKESIVWMQSNVVTIQPSDDLVMTSAEKIQQIAQQQGIAITSQQMGEQIQLSAQHENYAILANLLTQLAQAGLSIEKMQLSKADGQIKLTATIQ
ncbi:type II secretion system protein GspM [Acinetobacter sp. TY1]|uniref:type II secretion system protein GspM n=1 Tax=unclassified Acinetobacter TaxID=196816 RepID=UPI00305143AA